MLVRDDGHHLHQFIPLSPLKEVIESLLSE